MTRNVGKGQVGSTVNGDLGRVTMRSSADVRRVANGLQRDVARRGML